MMVLVGCNAPVQEKDLSQKADSVLRLLSLEEKIGQLNQLRGRPTTPTNTKDTRYVIEDEIRAGRVGTFLNVHPLEEKMALQKIAVEGSPHGIPLIFAMDILHGFRTTFPVPLGEAASWDVPGIERSARISAIEGAAVGFMWTMAPMVDISFDARWGRVMEGAGEDPYLASLIAKARVKGFQGEDLALPNTILACAKHFAGYGQVLAGRDYNQTVISQRFLHDYVFPPFKAAHEAGVGTLMSAFTDYDGIPANASHYLLTEVLREQWGFQGPIISDFNSLEELVNWGVASSVKDAARMGFNAGTDIDMMGLVYIDHLADLVREGKVKEATIDTAAKRVLIAKFKLGLFDDPYRYFTPGLDEDTWLTPAHRQHAREIARASMVLLKNEEDLLPLSTGDYGTIAVIGPTDADAMNLMGTWSAWGKPGNVVGIVKGLQEASGAEVLFAEGCNQQGTADPALMRKALETAGKADLVVLTLGEGWRNSGENTSLAKITLPQVQIELAQQVQKLGKPVVCVLFNGRPMAFPWLNENMPTILEAWLPGTEAGNALADVLFGKYNPSGKLPMTFPRHAGQVPITYLEKRTGRPYKQGKNYTKYLDMPNEPAYAFGYGLSYTTFEYAGIRLDQDKIGFTDTLKASVTIKNTGDHLGREVVQLYASDLVASVSRPMKQLIGFKRIELQPGGEEEVHFKVTSQDLRYWNKDMIYQADPGEFKLFIGTSSAEGKEVVFTLE